MKTTLEQITEALDEKLYADLIARIRQITESLDEMRELAEHFYSEGNFQALYELTMELMDE